jgi:hypothetical protein
MAAILLIYDTIFCAAQHFFELAAAILLKKSDNRA